jgi:hypothetical protein
MGEKDFWGLGAFAAGVLLWYRRILIGRSIVSVVLAVRNVLKRRTFMDISSLKSLVFVAASLGNIAGETMEDGKVDTKDIALIGKLIPVFPAILAIDFAAVIPEAKDLSESEALELVDLFKAQFNIPQDDLEVKIETVLSLCVRLSGIVAELVALFKKPEAR